MAKAKTTPAPTEPEKPLDQAPPVDEVKATEAPSPGAAAAADQPAIEQPTEPEKRIEDLGISYTYPLGLVKGVVTLPDGRRIERTRTNALQVNDAILAAWNDPTAKPVEHA